MILYQPTRRGDQVTVTFVLPLNGGRVAVVGDFNGWNPDANPLRPRDGHFTASITLSAGRRYVFRYVDSDGHWFNDDTAAAEPNGYGDHNSVIDLRGR